MEHEYLSGATAAEVGRKYGLTVAGAMDWLRKRRLTRPPSVANRTYAVNHDAFAVISPESAYWAGFLMTDGCILDGKGRSRIVKLALQIRDASAVEAFRSFVGSNHPIHQEKGDRGGFNGGMQCSFRVPSNAMACDLINLGIVPRKTHTAIAAKSLASNRDFWRGCVDGDGSVCLWTYKKHRFGVMPNIMLCGASKGLLDQFQAFCKSSVPESSPIVQRNNAVWRVSMHGRFAISLAKVLYGNCSAALARKQETAQRIIALAKEDPAWCVGAYLPEVKARAGRSRSLFWARRREALSANRGFSLVCT